ncbi:serpin family protein [Cyanobacterium sp. IPPAS B-1200]|uniref:serpin family protein n=1 Tax=Cyanobacterium sp. IPPAS B-1200 TaxID=1562720 RepID=UPI0008525B62|nr:serpin family protein [Cyanobacterium sp. IPPAS B-1200]OEJ77552.1 proteinase inhibitor I4 serpin [Cyanobacterium sp. IPPAS B-1200]
MLNNNQGKILLATFLLLTASFVAINPNLDKIFTTNNAVYAERDNSSMTESETEQLDEKIVNANRNFAFKLFSAIREKDDTENIFISAPSISIALNLLNNGADGDTREEIKQVLELQEISLPEINQQYKILQKLLQNQEESTLSINNSLWIREGFPVKPDFLSQNREYYESEVSALDFDSPDAVDTINNWVSDATEEKITSIIESISPEDVLFLINAIYFNGEWQQAFDPELTREMDFTQSNGEVIQHPLMSREGNFTYVENDDLQMIRLPYGESEDLAMYVVLPQEDSSLDAVMGELNADTWQEWTASLNRREGTIRLPRFTVEYDISLNDVLQKLGISKAFTNEADFTNLTDEPVSIDQVKHKTFIDVNEEGTEAAAVTSIGVRVTSLPVDPPFEMSVNRPFFYAIQDEKTDTILFMGTVNNL